MYKSVISWQSSRLNNQVFYHDIAGTLSLSLSDDEDLDPRLFIFFLKIQSLNFVSIIEQHTYDI